MKILIAEDQADIGELYKDVLGSRGHEIKLTINGRDCLDTYHAGLSTISDKSKTPFDVAIIDYSMPIMDGLQAAKEILKLRPDQRIIFASAHVEDTLVEAVKSLKMVVELLQKPFSIDVLVNTVEDTNLYEQLSRLNVDIKRLRGWNPDHIQLAALTEELTRLRNGKSDFKKILNAS